MALGRLGTRTRRGCCLKCKLTSVSTSSTRKIIIDCKYTPEATKAHFGAEKLRSSHLFQIHAYMDNLPPDSLSDTCEMMLLYPTADTALSATFTHNAHSFKIPNT